MLDLFLYNRHILFNSWVIAEIFIPTAEHVISTGRQTNETNAEIQTLPGTVKTKINKCLT